LMLAALSGCAAYSERGTGEGGSRFNSKGYSVRCDATPPNQPGCYDPLPPFPWWFPLDKLGFVRG
jgi:hypothetical protein